MRPVNLIPPEDRRGDRAPLRAGPLAYIVVAGLLLAFVGVYILVSTGNTISERKAAISSLEQQLASTQARAEALASFTEFAGLEQSRTETISSLARSRFDWERVMRELALVIPADASLSALSGTVGGDAAAGGEGGTTQTQGAASPTDSLGVPTMKMAGCASDHESVARLVAALRDIDGVTRVGLSSSAASGSEAGSAAPTAGATEGATCTDATSFDITVAFDDVQVDPASGGVIPEAPTGQPDGSGVSETQAEDDPAAGSVDAAEGAAGDAASGVLPGA